ncbi:MAG: hypothetical protein HY245_03970 [Rhizobiales bacterium]|nr:hypothetical protein [Hyphomicrobiales bacterium]MBI3672579.1 hypothetical protein [Hyphomicrobiales bacterium]
MIFVLPRGGSDICKQLKAGNIPNIINSWTGLSVIRSADGDEPQIDDKRWQDISSDAKVSIGVALFCRSHPDSQGSTFLTGYYSGKIIASVIDGNYFDQ